MTTAKLILTNFEGNASGNDGDEVFDMLVEGEMEVSYDVDSETLYFSSEWEDFGMGRKKTLSIKIDGVDEIDALSRYLRMILEQIEASRDSGGTE